MIDSNMRSVLFRPER